MNIYTSVQLHTWIDLLGSGGLYTGQVLLYRPFSNTNIFSWLYLPLNMKMVKFQRLNGSYFLCKYYFRVALYLTELNRAYFLKDTVTIKISNLQLLHLHFSLGYFPKDLKHFLGFLHIFSHSLSILHWWEQLGTWTGWWIPAADERQPNKLCNE